MPLNSSCRLRITIGGLDFTPCYENFTIGAAHLNESGLCKLEGSLVLYPTQNQPPPVELNPRSRPDFWIKGQSVLVDVYNTVTGLYERHTFGNLKILREPKPPKRDGLNPELTLDVGCILARFDFRQDDDDKSNVKLGDPVPRLDIINALLATVGIPAATGTVSGSLEYPVPKTGGGSYPELAAKVAFAGGSVLWQDKTGQVVVEPILFPPASPFITALEAEQQTYDPLDSSETPAEEVKCVGNKYDVTDQWLCTISDSSSFSSGVSSVSISRKTTITECLDATSRQQTTTVYEPEAVVYPEDLPNSQGLTFSSQTIETWYYEGDITEVDGKQTGGKLIQSTKQVIRPFAAAVAQFWSTLSTAQKASYTRSGLITALSSITNYKYSKEEVPEVFTTISREPIGAIIPDLNPTTNPPSGIVLSGIDAESWQEVRPGTWTKVTTKQEPLIRAIPNLADGKQTSVKLGLTTSDSTIETSASGGTQPPACERRPDRYSQTEKQIEGSYKQANLSGETERKRVYNIEFPSSEEDLNKAAKTLSQLLVGRKFGYRVEVPWTEAWLSLNSILPRIDITESDGTKQTAIASGLSFSHTPDEAIVGFDAVWLGKVVQIVVGGTPVEVVKPPLPEIAQISFGLGFGFTTNPIPYPLSASTSSVFGLGFGFVSTLRTSATFTFGLGFGFSTVHRQSGASSTLGLGFGFSTSSRTIKLPSNFGLGFGFSSTLRFTKTSALFGLGFGFTSNHVGLATPASGYSRWWKASTGTTVDGSNFVSQWSDAGGNLATMTVNSVYQPLLTTFGGKAVIRFDGADDYMIVDAATFQTRSIYVVFRRVGTTWNDYDGVIGCRVSNNRTGVSASAEDAGFTGVSGDVNITGIVAAATGIYVDGVAGSTTNFNNYLVGATMPSDNNMHVVLLEDSASTNSFKQFVFGCDPFADIGGRQANVEIGEILIYPTIHNSTDRDQTHNYLKTRWGIT